MQQKLMEAKYVWMQEKLWLPTSIRGRCEPQMLIQTLDILQCPSSSTKLGNSLLSVLCEHPIHPTEERVEGLNIKLFVAKKEIFSLYLIIILIILLKQVK